MLPGRSAIGGPGRSNLAEVLTFAPAAAGRVAVPAFAGQRSNLGGRPANSASLNQIPVSAMSDKPIKPLGRKAYGSIPHLPTSRLGAGEHHVHEGQARICTAKSRDRHDRVVVTEKLDGANVAIAKIDGRIIALGRAGYPAETAPQEHIRLFGDWVRSDPERWAGMLGPGEALHGEWLALAHGTRYELQHEPFVAFDLTAGGKRLGWDEVLRRCRSRGVVTPELISDGPPVSVESVRAVIDRGGGHGVVPPDAVEGAVWRVERRGRFDFMAKWVRPEKVDGKYFDSPIWHWRPD